MWRLRSTVTLNIKRVDTGGKIYVAYRKVAVLEAPDVPKPQMTANRFVVSTRSSSTGTVEPTALMDAANDAINIAGGLGQALAGSGEMKVSPEVVAVGSKPRTVTFTYTARAAISGCHFHPYASY